MKTSIILTVCLTLMVSFAGCASPDARIKRSPEMFARLSPEQQALVKEGKVGIGFDAEAVQLAIGKPDRIWTRTDAAGTNELWGYTRWENDLGQPLYSGWYHRYYGGGGYYPLYYTDYPYRREYEYFRVVFGPDRKVTAVEQDSRR
jgi:hypothetical protein